jgi:hypothetical protein
VPKITLVFELKLKVFVHWVILSGLFVESGFTFNVTDAVAVCWTPQTL